MTFAIITHAIHIRENQDIFAYRPYVKEMNIWLKYVDNVVIVSPFASDTKGSLHLSYLHKKVEYSAIPNISLISFIQIIRTLFMVPIILIRIFAAMRRADHIHLRCPGNIGLLGCLVQVFFPWKIKTAKYAGNWDPDAKQPISYRFQKWILSNTFLTRNMTVLVYGKWPNQSKNVKSFFTATYFKTKVTEVLDKKFNGPYKFLFVGSLSKGKRPLYAVKLIELLYQSGIKVRLELYGDGSERPMLEAYIEKQQLGENVILHGNESQEVIEKAYQESQFLLLPSKSEGWPKVVAESMFWGCVPMVSKISCVPWMLDQGTRGVLLSMNLEEDASKIEQIITQENKLNGMSANAKEWSQQYTLDSFEAEIKSLL